MMESASPTPTKPPPLVSEYAETEPAECVVIETSLVMFNSCAESYACTFAPKFAVAVGALIPAKPNETPSADDDDLPSPVGGLIVRRETPPGPKSLFV